MCFDLLDSINSLNQEKLAAFNESISFDDSGMPMEQYLQITRLNDAATFSARVLISCTGDGTEQVAALDALREYVRNGAHLLKEQHARRA